MTNLELYIPDAHNAIEEEKLQKDLEKGPSYHLWSQMLHYCATTVFDKNKRLSSNLTHEEKRELASLYAIEYL